MIEFLDFHRLPRRALTILHNLASLAALIRLDGACKQVLFDVIVVFDVQSNAHFDIGAVFFDGR